MNPGDDAPTPSQFRVRLDDVFAGPLDLLLHLVQENEVEISEVSLARVCDQFLRFVRDIAEVDLGLAGDYLVVASTLVALKSRSLVANGEEVEIEDEIDPGDDLVRRLLQYRRVREAARDLARRSERRASIYERGQNEMPAADPGEVDLGDATAYDLLTAFARLLREVGGARASHAVGAPDRSVAEYVKDVAAALRASRELGFRALFGEAQDRGAIIGVFLAILELGKQRAVRARQDGAYGEIVVERAVESIEQFDRIVEGIVDPEDGAIAPETSDASAPPTSTTPEARVMVSPPPE